MSGFPTDVISPPSARFLLDLSHEALESAVAGREPVAPRAIPTDVFEHRGAFVTLEKDGQLRGCMGWVRATRPLWETIQEVTVSSATRDPRFEPVTARELPSITIQISILSPLERISSLSEIEIGRHGLYVRRDDATGLLLPQVAERLGLDAPGFLRLTLGKAGIETEDEDVGFDDLEVYRFDVQRLGPTPRP